MAENVLELKNLNVKFELEEDTVEAVNGISIHLDQERRWGLLARLVQEKRQQHCLFKTDRFSSGSYGM